MHSEYAGCECFDQTARNAQADLSLHCPHVPEDTFVHDAATNGCDANITLVAGIR